MAVDRAGVHVLKSISGSNEILTPESLRFLEKLHRQFNSTRLELLQLRKKRQASLDAGELPEFLKQTASVRNDPQWRVAPVPADLEDRRVEITGPAEPKMMINALNSGAKVFMADLEDALSPTWQNLMTAHIALRDAVQGQLEFQSPEGKRYCLAKDKKLATLLVRPRGWHLHEKHLEVDGEPLSASLTDFGLYSFWNAQERINRGTGIYFYLPKLESHLEARLWADVFRFAEDELRIPRSSIRATVLIETILAAFEMDEILYELRDHCVGLNAGRWDYLFSIIKKFRNSKTRILPDRSQLVMTVPFMRAYTELLVKTCHKRGAHAIGGMAAFVPSRKDAKINEIAFQKVRADKERECNDGFDGTWVAHPDLVPIAMEVFASAPHQKSRLRTEVNVAAADLIHLKVEGGKISEEGIRNNINVALQYLSYWISGTGAAAIYNLMEDAATAEIARAQLWQWLHHSVALTNGSSFTRQIYELIRDEELKKIEGFSAEILQKAKSLLDTLVLDAKFTEFLTLPAYEILE